MPINFLDIAPKPATETVVLDTAAGPVDVELLGVPLAELSALAKRYPTFARIIEGHGGSIFEAAEALPPLIAAALGHPGEPEYEAHVREFSTADIMRLAEAVIRLTFPRAAAGPLPDAPVNGADPPQPETISPQPSSS